MRIDRGLVEQAYRDLRLPEIEAYFQEIEQRINDVVNTDSYQGRGARAMKAYLSEVHGMSVKSFIIILMQIESGMNRFLTNFSQVDESNRAILDEGYLKHIRDVINNFRRDMQLDGREFSRQMSAASQVMSLSGGSFNNAMGNLDQELTQAMKTAEDTNETMHSFNAQQMAEVESLNEHLSTLERVLDKIKVIAAGGIDNFRPGSFANSPLGKSLFNHMVNSVALMARNGSTNEAIDALSILAGFINTLPLETRRLFESIKGRVDWCALIGDPVNAATGNFIYDHVDIKIEGRYPLEFKRFYNSLDATTSTLGRNWTHTYDIRIREVEDDGVTIIYGDSRQEHYDKPEKENIFVSAPSNFNTLRKLSDEKGYELEFTDGGKYLFNKEGQLTQQVDQAGNEVKLSYDADQLIKVESLSGYLELAYEGDYIEKVSDHTGRTICFEYENDLLSIYTNVLGNSYSYEYDLRKRLVKIVNPEGNLVVENVYDEKDRVANQAYADGSGMSYKYPSFGKRKKSTEFTKQNASIFTYKRDDQYRTTGIVEPDGEVKIEYNKNSQRSKYIDKHGNETSFEYDKDNLIRIENALGEITELSYDDNNQLTKISVDGIVKLENEYNQEGNLVAIKDALKRQVRFSYDRETKGMPTHIVQPDGSVIKVQYDNRKNITNVTDAFGVITYYEYDQLNRVIKTTDGNGNDTHFSYDDNNNLTHVTNASGDSQTFEYNQTNKVVKITNFNNSITQREYNKLGKVSKVIDPLNRETKLGYDSMWNVNEIVQPNGAKTKLIYNKMNQLEVIEKPDGSKIVYAYDAVGNRIGVADEERNITKFRYDALNNLTQVIDVEGNTTTYTYNNEGQVIRITDATGNVIELEYDDAGQIIKETNVLGESRHYSYTSLGKIETIKDEAGRLTTYDYEPGGRLKSIHHPTGTTESFTYDGNGNIKNHTNQLGLITTYNYDCLNRVIEIINANGSSKKYTYCPVGNVTKMVDELGNSTHYEYTLTSQLSKVIDPLGNETHYTYDLLDQLIEVKQLGGIDGTDGIDVDLTIVNEHNEANRITIYNRNQLGQVESITDALGNSESFKYSPRGELVEKVDKDGYLTKYAYTAQGDISQIQYADGREVALSYNPLRQLTEIKDWLGTTQIEVDALGRATKVTNHNNEVIAYEFGPLGERKSITYPDGKRVGYEYDEALRLTQVNDGDHPIHYHYNDFSRLTGKTFSNGTKTQYDYDNLGQLSSLTHFDQEELLDKYIYNYDLAGNKTSIKKQRQGLDIDSGMFDYEYDSLNRLTEVMKNGQVLRSYSYDSFGNRTKMVENDREIAYTYNSLNQLIASTDGKSYSYDKRGNLTQVLKHDNVINSYVFGELNRLEKTFNFEKNIGASYTYNGLGHRVGKTEGVSIEPILPTVGVEAINLNPAKQIDDVLDLTKQYNNLLQRSEDGVSNSYTYDFDVLSSSNEQGSYNYLLDDLGSPIRFDNEVYEYDEFGVPLHNIENTNSTFSFTGYQFDPISDTYFAQARQYDPTTGRFTSQDTHWHTGNMIYGDRRTYSEVPAPLRGIVPDPLAMGQANNLYGYVMNDPVNRWDPDGKGILTTLVIVAGAAFIAGTTANACAQVVSDISWREAGAAFNTYDWSWDTAWDNVSSGFSNLSSQAADGWNNIDWREARIAGYQSAATAGLFVLTGPGGPLALSSAAAGTAGAMNWGVFLTGSGIFSVGGYEATRRHRGDDFNSRDMLFKLALDVAFAGLGARGALRNGATVVQRNRPSRIDPVGGGGFLSTGASYLTRAGYSSFISRFSLGEFLTSLKGEVAPNLIDLIRNNIRGGENLEFDNESCPVNEPCPVR